jgi:hypothetical protein
LPFSSDLLVQATFHLSDYYVSQIPHLPPGGTLKNFFGAAKVGICGKNQHFTSSFFVNPMFKTFFPHTKRARSAGILHNSAHSELLSGIRDFIASFS